MEADDDLPDTFTPLRPPRHAVIETRGVTPALLRVADLRIDCALAAGRHPVPVGRSATLTARVEPGARLSARVTVSDEDGAPVIDRGELRFDPPLALGDVAAALTELPQLVDDLIGAAQRDAPAWLAPLARVFASGERVGQIHLSRAHLRRTVGGRRLRVAFDGHVSWLGQVATPFFGVTLPSRLIPAIHRGLADMPASSPFVSGTGSGGRVDPVTTEQLARALSALIEAAEGHVTLALDPIELAGVVHLGDGSALTLTLPPLGRASVSASFALTRREQTMALTARGLRLAWPDVELQADLALELPSSPREERSTAARRPELRLTRPLRVDRLPLRATLTHPALHGETSVEVTARDLTVTGRVAFRDALPASAPDIEIDAVCGSLDLAAAHADPRGRLELAARLGGQVALRRALIATAAGAASRSSAVTLAATFAGDARVTGERRLAPLPELGVHHGALDLELVTALRGDARARLTTGAGPARASLDAATVTALLTRGHVALDGVTLALPAGARVDARVEETVLDTGGLGHARLIASWTLGTVPLRLLARDARPDDAPIPLGLARLASGALQVALSSAGRVTLRSLLDARPAPTWAELLESDDLVATLSAIAGAFEPSLGTLTRDLRRLALRVRRVLDREGVREPRDAIARANLARVLGGLLDDAPDLPERLTPIIAAVTDGDGLDVAATRAILAPILARALAAHPRLATRVEARLDDALRWLALLLGPTERLHPPPTTAAPPLALDPAWAEPLSAWPSAAALYRAAEGAALVTPSGAHATLSGVLPALAPYLTLDQLDALLDVAEPALAPPAAARARYALALKRRAGLIAGSYGGLDHAPQALAIGLFLADAVRVSRRTCPYPPRDAAARDDHAPARIYDVLLGPAEVARLLQAGLSALLQGRAVQLDQRLLLDELFARPAGFVVQVLTELSAGSTRILAAALNALLDLEQGLMRCPLGVHALLEACLGFALPRRADFMPGGATAEASYYEALLAAAGRILDLGRPYLALRDHLQVARRPAPVSGPLAAGRTAALADKAQRAIAHADAFAAALDPRDLGDDTRAAAHRAYAAAFGRCAKLLDTDQAALAAPWLRTFWARNHDALTVRSVVANHQGGVDDVRRWLTVRTGRDAFATEQDLVDAAIDALYLHEADRRAVSADPLTRLLIPHPPGPLDFTIVTCMGVITEGAAGRELEETLARLTRERGVGLVRADTATFRPLGDNAERVERALSEVTTPWGWIGYSQGAANGFAAEARLIGQSPARRRVLAGLRCRHLLFSAANGSSHGAGADLKFRRAVVAGDLALKPLQAALSPRAVELALQGLRLALDSRPLIKALAGARSLSHAGVIDLARDGQFAPHVPTTSVRAQVAHDTLPEALELLANLLTRQSGTTAHDTQVTVDEAVAELTAIASDETRALAATCVPARIQATHHWAPLWHEILPLRTARDVERAIYDGPRDRLVFPWVELNARFGRIRRQGQGPSEDN